MTRHQIATAIRKRSQKVVAKHDTSEGRYYQRDGYVETTVVVGDTAPFGEFYGDGDELVAEAYREAIVAMGQRTTVPVTMTVQWHPHPMELAECRCADTPDHGYVWRNSAADHPARAGV
jgi:hypothetical protein